MVAAVATDEPEVAAKIEQDTILACISPPGSHESQPATALYIRLAMPDRRMISPIRMNIGMAISRKFFCCSHVFSPIARIRRPFM